MIMKCIGGPNDGEHHDVFDNFQYGDIWRIKDYPKLTMADAILDKPILETIKYNEYVLDEISTYKIKVKFLRYRETTIEQIFLKLFQ